MSRFWNVTFQMTVQNFTLKGGLEEYGRWRFARKEFHGNQSFVSVNLVAK
jgi:hypothetical protein